MWVVRDDTKQRINFGGGGGAPLSRLILDFVGGGSGDELHRLLRLYSEGGGMVVRLGDGDAAGATDGRWTGPKRRSWTRGGGRRSRG
jgi:hypothetical protein